MTDTIKTLLREYEVITAKKAAAAMQIRTNYHLEKPYFMHLEVLVNLVNEEYKVQLDLLVSLNTERTIWEQEQNVVSEVLSNKD